MSLGSVTNLDTLPIPLRSLNLPQFHEVPRGGQVYPLARSLATQGTPDIASSSRTPSQYQTSRPPILLVPLMSSTMISRLPRTATNCSYLPRI